MSGSETNRHRGGSQNKAILILLKQDILDAAQVCVGQESGCEVIHAMHQIFADEETEGAVLVDATNAFNLINWQAAFHNISIMCPPLAQVLFNTYQAQVRCLIQGGSEISSSEGTTQGDPLAMAFTIRHLIDRLQLLCPTVKQVCSELRAW